MKRVEKTVFLSYRRSDAGWALAVFQALTHKRFDVFFDFTGIASGKFEEVILQNIRARAHFIVLLTPSALQRTNKPDDWLRREIEEALSASRNIVPLLFPGFDFDAPEVSSELTGKLAELKKYNGLEVSPTYFDEAMERLSDKYLSVPLETVLQPASTSAIEAAESEKQAAHAYAERTSANKLGVRIALTTIAVIFSVLISFFFSIISFTWIVGVRLDWLWHTLSGAAPFFPALFAGIFGFRLRPKASAFAGLIAGIFGFAQHFMVHYSYMERAPLRWPLSLTLYAIFGALLFFCGITLGNRISA